MMPVRPISYAPADVAFSADDLAPRIEPRKILLCSPEHFDVKDEKNVHMQGQQGKVDRARAFRQWESLVNIYGQLKNDGILDDVRTIPGAEDTEDMVFCANQTFPWTVRGERVVLMSRMRHASRRREVVFFENFFRELGYTILKLEESKYTLEGMGDMIPHVGRQLIYGGYGYRTDPEVYQEVAEKLQAPVVMLHLTDPRFYHLDTCFIPMDEHSVLLCREAFDEQSLGVIRKLFKDVHEVPVEEAEKLFSLNAHLITGSQRKKAVLQQGTVVTKNVLTQKGFDIIETDTSEFMKSGGSVFCMKMMFY